MSNIITFDLKFFIDELTTNFPNIEEIHIFGSRGYQTNSKRSDIDLLLTPLKSAPILDKTQLQKFQDGFPPVDLFINREYSAQSLVNNSEILKRTEKSLVEQLEAKCLWKKDKGFCVENSVYFSPLPAPRIHTVSYTEYLHPLPRSPVVSSDYCTS